jgi:hypothetical protein
MQNWKTLKLEKLLYGRNNKLQEIEWKSYLVNVILNRIKQ